MPKVSIIVPVYNSECYLAECIDSILAQSYTDFELILVDDGSSDESPSICDKYSVHDNRVNCIHIENKGVSYARNLGLDTSIGEYVSFVDSDDLMEKDFLLSAVTEMEADAELDFIQYSIDKFDEKGIFYQENAIDLTLLNMDFIDSNNFWGTVWGSLLKTDIIHKASLYFNTDLKLGEDQAFIYEYLINCRKCAKRSEIQYHYRSNQQSVTHTPSSDSLMASIKFFKTFKYKETFSKRVDTLLLSLSMQLAFIDHVPMKDIYLLCKDINFSNVDIGTRKLEDIFLKIYPYSRYLAFFIIRILNAAYK